MATFNKINDFVQNAVHDMDLASDQITVALSNTAPSAESSDPSADGNGVLANVTQLSYTYLSSRNVTTSSSAQTGGVYKLTLADLTLTASGGSCGPFRYIYLYNDTVAGDPLIGYYDYGSALTLNDGDGLTIDFDDAAGALTIT